MQSGKQSLEGEKFVWQTSSPREGHRLIWGDQIFFFFFFLENFLSLTFLMHRVGEGEHSK